MPRVITDYAPAPALSLAALPEGPAIGAALLKLSDLAPGATATLRVAGADILLRALGGGRVGAYVNRCPHMDTPLNSKTPKVMLTPAGDRFVCQRHGAEFDIETGMCVSGPCLGIPLDRVSVRVEDGVVKVA